MFSDLIQQYKESDEAVRYMTFYKITDWPYIAIIDPRTGRIDICPSNFQIYKLL